MTDTDHDRSSAYLGDSWTIHVALPHVTWDGLPDVRLPRYELEGQPTPDGPTITVTITETDFDQITHIAQSGDLQLLGAVCRRHFQNPDTVLRATGVHLDDT